MSHAASDPRDPIAEILLSAGIADARERIVADPAITDIITTSRTLRELDLGEIPMSSVFRAGWSQ